MSVNVLAQKKGSTNITDACNREEAAEKSKAELPPYRYGSLKTTNITFKPYDQVKEIAIPLFYDTGYRLVFNLEGLPQDVKVEIYDKAVQAPGKNMLFESGSQKQFVFEPTDKNLDKVYVVYKIPATKNTDSSVIEKGCIVLVTGFENV